MTVAAVDQPRERDYASIIGNVFVVALAVLAILFLALPVVWIFVGSFLQTGNPISAGSMKWTFANYRTIIENDFLIFIFNSVFICIVAVIICTALAVMVAYAFSRYRFPLKRMAFASIVLGQLFPWVILVTPLFVMFAKAGLLNSYVGMIFCYVCVSLPFSVYMLVGYLEAVPRDLDEAAAMDGCSRVQIVLQVVLPLMLPGIVATATYSFLLMWTEYLFALAFLTETTMKTMPLGLALFFGQDTVDWGAVMAASAATTLPALLLFLPLQSKLVSGVTSGSVKG
ncbi:MAG: carbohydrate ABC transporter permease [Roseibium sp.]|uniref:carbohydrate ABC transporter permease n=1 Tax=Roseibium sp. TaxID=1936156 RepID=UPI0026041B50|nr:carbohydrate ABC transporter permease [Roseibium sp.]MCV0424151.1 carbohydrate ABC transporter permease [Roseibium sp.]